MKKNNDNRLEELIRFYGSLESYHEEQRRLGLVAIERAARSNPLVQQMLVENLWPVEELKAGKIRPARRPFWSIFLG